MVYHCECCLEWKEIITVFDNQTFCYDCLTKYGRDLTKLTRQRILKISHNFTNIKIAMEQCLHDFEYTFIKMVK